MKTKIYADYTAFYNRTDKTENGVSIGFAAIHPDWEKENASNEACFDCYGCSRCSGCSGLKNAKPVAQEAGKSWFDVPTIPNIHSTVLKAVEQPGRST